MYHEFIAQYGTMIIYAVLVFVAGIIGNEIKNVYEKHCNDKQKRAVVKSVVKAVRQMYKDLDGPEKLEKAIEAAREWLDSKGISYTDLELRMLIEDVCDSFHEGLNGEDEADED